MRIDELRTADVVAWRDQVHEAGAVTALLVLERPSGDLLLRGVSTGIATAGGICLLRG